MSSGIFVPDFFTAWETDQSLNILIHDITTPVSTGHFLYGTKVACPKFAKYSFHPTSDKSLVCNSSSVII